MAIAHLEWSAVLKCLQQPEMRAFSFVDALLARYIILLATDRALVFALNKLSSNQSRTCNNGSLGVLDYYESSIR